MPHAETIEFPRKRYSTWTLRPAFEAIVSGWFPASHGNTRKCCGIPPQVVSRLEETTGLFPPACNHCTAMQRSGRGARSGTNGHYSDAPKRSLHGGFSEILEIPW
jgi:hypothetical protein